MVASGVSQPSQVVLERSVAGTAIGAGLLLWPNAVRALDALGHGSGVRAVAAPARHTVFRDAAGRTLSEVNVERLGSRAGAPMLVVERPALHEQNPSPDDGQGGPK
jgi:2-polyprenyl-6-methoxyphenol hydroxylase-like FAD-dependent oxidoreductase